MGVCTCVWARTPMCPHTHTHTCPCGHTRALPHARAHRSRFRARRGSPPGIQSPAASVGHLRSNAVSLRTGTPSHRALRQELLGTLGLCCDAWVHLHLLRAWSLRVWTPDATRLPFTFRNCPRPAPPSCIYEAFLATGTPEGPSAPLPQAGGPLRAAFAHHVHGKGGSLVCPPH